MARLYEKSVAELMVEAAAALSYPASRSDVLDWFAEHYPDVKPSTVRAHIVGLTANDRSRSHYAWLAKRDALFQRNESGMLTAFDPAGGAGFDDEDSVEAEDGAPPLEFALEAFLEEFLHELGRDRLGAPTRAMGVRHGRDRPPARNIGRTARFSMSGYGVQCAGGDRTQERPALRSCGRPGGEIHGTAGS
jgi:hypothetical protein